MVQKHPAQVHQLRCDLQAELLPENICSQSAEENSLKCCLTYGCLFPFHGCCYGRGPTVSQSGDTPAAKEMSLFSAG